MPWIKHKKPDLSCLDTAWLPVTKRTPREVSGPKVGTIYKQGQSKKCVPAVVKKETSSAKPKQSKVLSCKHTPTKEEIEAEIAKIRRVKDLLRELGKDV